MQATQERPAPPAEPPSARALPSVLRKGPGDHLNQVMCQMGAWWMSMPVRRRVIACAVIGGLALFVPVACEEPGPLTPPH